MTLETPKTNIPVGYLSPNGEKVLWALPDDKIPGVEPHMAHWVCWWYPLYHHPPMPGLDSFARYVLQKCKEHVKDDDHLLKQIDIVLKG